MDVERHLALALDLADIADGITTERFRSLDLAVSAKPDDTPVTEADLAVERAIRDHLAIEARDHAILGEEYGTEEGDDSEFRWIIDPIDGTKSYLRGVPVWASLIALEQAGTLELGVVSAPALHTRWWAGRGLGAFRNGESIRVSTIGDLTDAHLSFAWDSNEAFERDSIHQRLLALGRRCWRVRALGDFWQHMLVAEGAFDISVDVVAALWDLAAVQLIVEEAGGRATTLAGVVDPAGGSIVCTNGRLHDEVLAALNP